MLNYTKEELWKSYESLPENLKEAIFSEETAKNIFNICKRNEIADSLMSEISKYVGYVLLKKIDSKEFEEYLVSDVGVEEEKAKRIFVQFQNLIFRYLPILGTENIEIKKEKIEERKSTKDSYKEKIEEESKEEDIIIN